MKSVAVGLLVFSASAMGASPPDIRLYDELLQQHVREDGRVRYGALREDLGQLEQFVRQIGEVSPDSHPDLFPSREGKLAYWINVYNALVLWAFAQDYPEKKDRLSGLLGRGLFFYRRKFLLGGEKLSLAHIENEILRKEFTEPRVHFAINCASASCPPLARRAYTAENLELMLERRTRDFLNQNRNVMIDAERRIVWLSKLFDWYKADFGRSDEAVLAFVARYLSAGGEQLLQGRWRIRFFEYDWSLNDAATPGA